VPTTPRKTNARAVKRPDALGHATAIDGIKSSCRNTASKSVPAKMSGAAPIDAKTLIADQADETPNPLVIDAFKPVIDAVLRFALVDDARRDGLDYLGKSNPTDDDRQRLARAEAELLADHVEALVSAEPNQPAQMRSRAALSELLAGVACLNGVFDVLRERAG
jgi:hypothetical protein